MNSTKLIFIVLVLLLSVAICEGETTRAGSRSYYNCSSMGMPLVLHYRKLKIIDVPQGGRSIQRDDDLHCRASLRKFMRMLKSNITDLILDKANRKKKTKRNSNNNNNNNKNMKKLHESDIEIPWVRLESFSIANDLDQYHTVQHFAPFLRYVVKRHQLPEKSPAARTKEFCENAERVKFDRDECLLLQQHNGERNTEVLNEINFPSKKGGALYFMTVARANPFFYCEYIDTVNREKTFHTKFAVPLESSFFNLTADVTLKVGYVANVKQCIDGTSEGVEIHEDVLIEDENADL